MNYQLIKDLPDLAKGAVFETAEDNSVYFHLHDEKLHVYSKSVIEKVDWFKKILVA